MQSSIYSGQTGPYVCQWNKLIGLSERRVAGYSHNPCQQAFDTLEQLVAHVEWHARDSAFCTEEGTMAFQCRWIGDQQRLCGHDARPFKRVEAAVAHAKSHLGVYDYTCAGCTRGFVNQAGLTQHHCVLDDPSVDEGADGESSELTVDDEDSQATQPGESPRRSDPSFKARRERVLAPPRAAGKGSDGRRGSSWRQAMLVRERQASPLRGEPSERVAETPRQTALRLKRERAAAILPGWERRCAQEPTSFEHRFNLAWCLVYTPGRADEAIRHLELLRLATEGKELRDTVFYLREAYKQTGQTAKIEELKLEIIRLDAELATTD